jgi:hypothetical protein
MNKRKILSGILKGIRLIFIIFSILFGKKVLNWELDMKCF